MCEEDRPEINIHKIYDVYVLKKLSKVIPDIKERIKFVNYLASDGNDPETFINLVDDILSSFCKHSHVRRRTHINEWYYYGQRLKKIGVDVWITKSKSFYRSELPHQVPRKGWVKMVFDKSTSRGIAWHTPDDLRRILCESYLSKVGPMYEKIGEGLRNIEKYKKSKQKALKRAGELVR
jgi:hypothetical protein